MTKQFNKAYSFDDVLLIPDYSTLNSRYDSKISTEVGGINLDVPVISAPMDTVTESNMASFMYEQGGLGIIHRYLSINQQYGHVKWVKETKGKVGAAIGINGDAWERAEAMFEAGADLLVIDVAHGHSVRALDFTKKLRERLPITLMSPNIVTRKACADYISAGVHAIRVGVGGGSACSTRLVAGVGYPQFSAIYDLADLKQIHPEISIVSDGGIKTSGDVVKALAAGADAVMVGGLLAPFNIAAGRTVAVPVENPIFKASSHRMMKEFRGMASESALSPRKTKGDYTVEGESFLVPIRYDAKEFMQEFIAGIQSGFAYLGAQDIIELRSNASFVEVSPNGIQEGKPNFSGEVR